MTRLDSGRLLALLHSLANARGIALAREGWLLDELLWDRARLEWSIKELVEDNALTLLSPLPFLSVRLKVWPNHTPKSPQTGPSPYSYKSSLLQSRLMKESYSHRQTDNSETLLQEILAVLGESDPATFRGAVHAYSPRAIRLTLGRVQRMKHIRKNRTALFRFLLPRVAKEADARD